MTPQETEDLFIRSLDVPMTAAEKGSFTKALKENPTLAKQLSDHKTIREVLRRTSPASFGHSFAVRLTARIENTGVIIERQIFTFFKKYQLLAAGIIVGLVILNTVFSETVNIDSTFGLENTTIPDTTLSDPIVSFDFYKTLNNDL